MRKTLKIIFCSLVIVAIMTANVFAGWEGYTPNLGASAQEYDLLYDENLRSSYSTMEFIALLDNAYELGLFGGNYPIAVLLTQLNSTTYMPYILCVSAFDSNIWNGAESEVAKNSVGSVYSGIDETITCLGADFGLSAWTIVPTGDMQAFAYIGVVYEMALNDSLYLLRNTDKTDGINGWYWDDNDSNFAQFYSVDGNVNNSIVEINELYEMALQNYIPPTPPSDPEPDPEPTPPVVNNFTYLLDIPSIITAIPNGAKQIINNAFGFEIFGINIAGLLSVFIIIAIVAYAVKKMMSR